MIGLLAEGKIIKSISGFYYVLSEDVVYQCRARGVFRKRKITPLVGDLVKFEADNGTDGYIIELLPRKNELVRPPIANVEQALVVFSVKEPDLSLQLLDKFLVHIEANEIEAIICFTKMDLLTATERERLFDVASLYRSLSYPIFFLSIVEQENYAPLKAYLKDKITVVAGQSGVGKSSLLNGLDTSLQIATNEISTHLGRGKHTTRHVELLPIAGGLVADTPGFSSLDLSHFNEEDLSLYFPEMKQRREKCKFRGCTHLAEPHCAVKDALKSGEIAESRYNHYVQFFNEVKETKRRY